MAAIDAGSNTTRLLAVEVAADGTFTELDRRLIFTRLGEGVDAHRRLAPAAIARTVAAIKDYTDQCAALGVSRVRIAGTSAVREAANREELRTAVREATGHELDVIPGEEEAALSFAGATRDLGAGRYLMCDIGGGSTELAVGRVRARAAEVEQAVSLPLGVVRMTERHLHHDPPGGAELSALESDVLATLEAAAGTLAEPGNSMLVGVAGTVTSLAAITLGLAAYDPKAVHGSWLSQEQINDLYASLATMPLAAREAIPSLPPGRADVIVAGCAILSCIADRWCFRGVRVSEKDILDGLVFQITGDH
ncbi:MAG TPA: Ppx/GppA phosphatase family protein [Actinomycetota bacterium]|nr:Ppx/GppA phosphatase family protein [Actinomycetota bacterium]